MHSMLINGFSRKLPVILQTEASECALACLAMVANFYGHNMDLQSLRARYGLSMKGVDVQELQNIATKLQLSSRPVRLELSELVNLKLPCILHWKLKHFVVLKKITGKKVIIHDPALGERHYNFSEVSDFFTGVAVELTPEISFQATKLIQKLSWNQLWSSIQGLNSGLLKLFVLSLLLQAFAMLAPLYMQTVVDVVVVSQDYSLLNILALGFCLLLMIDLITSLFRGLLLISMSSQFSLQLASGLFYRLMNLPLEWYEKRHSADIISRFGSLDTIQKFFTVTIVEGLVDGLMVLGTLSLMWMYQKDLTLIVLFVLFLYGLVRNLLYAPLRRLNEEQIQFKAQETSYFIESIHSAQAIKLANFQQQRQQQWSNKFADTTNVGIRLGQLNLGYRAINQLLFGLENIIIIYLAAKSVMGNEMSLGMLFAFIAYKAQFVSKSTNLIEKLIQLRMLDLHLQRVADIALTAPEVKLETIEYGLSAGGDIEVQNLSYRYSENEKDIIEKFNCTITTGESVAIVGPSGVGKTTLMKLLVGLLTPQSGKILLNGVDIQDIGTQNFRNQLGVVMQDDSCLSGTIADNICFFDPKIDLERVRACASLAMIDSDIMAMPMAYHSMIGEMGATLSGGQQQRVLLARALYRKPSILFLDEATAHLDEQTQSVINQNIAKLPITRVFIAHRRSTIAMADRVIDLSAHHISTSELKIG